MKIPTTNLGAGLTEDISSDNHYPKPLTAPRARNMAKNSKYFHYLET